jgi:hypothetical protein
VDDTDVDEDVNKCAIETAATSSTPIAADEETDDDEDVLRASDRPVE